MKVPAKLSFVTVQGERSEFAAEGFIENTADKTVIFYNGDGYSLAVETDGNRATVTRTGDSPYVMTLEEGAAHDFGIDSLRTKLLTKKLRLMKKDTGLKFWAEYLFGNDDSTLTQIIIKATYN